MKITWLGHASFLVEGEGKRIITDPYDPEILKIQPVDLVADIVVRSSDDDRAHCCIDFIPPGYTLLTATDHVHPDFGSAEAEGIDFSFALARESLIHKEDPGDNGMYRFSLEGVSITHMGDVGNPLSEKQIEFMKGTDILLALAGGPPVIETDDLMQVIEAVRPAIVIPMHYRIPGPEFFMFPVEVLSERFPPETVVKRGGSALELTRESIGEMKDTPRLIVLEADLLTELCCFLEINPGPEHHILLQSGRRW
jgi:L-ascorbate metabolism protein UlaG (beta-lactamase superfamily)